MVLEIDLLLPLSKFSQEFFFLHSSHREVNLLLMAANELPPLPVFDGEGYDDWAIMIRTLFHSQDLGDLVEKEIPDNEYEARLKGHKKRDAKAV